MVRKSMIKRTLSCIMALTMAVSGITVGTLAENSSEKLAYAEGELTYTVGNSTYSYVVSEDGTVEITGYEGTDTELTIPREIDGKSVTSIGSAAFLGWSSMTEVTIPNSVTSIGNWTFDGCSSMTEVTIPDSVTSIGYYAFYGCSSMTEVTIPNSVTSIGDSAFSDCSSMKEVTISNSVTSIEYSTFYGCSSITEVTIPNSVTSIESYAFYGCSSMTEVTIPNSVTRIGYRAFEGCSSITEVTIPDSVTSIEYSTFYGCSSLTEVIIPDSVTSIGDSAFSGCSSLTEVIIPGSVTGIGDGVFRGCSSLTEVTIPNSVTYIGASTFKGCSSITEVIIPDSVTSIGDSAFSGCDNITIYGEKDSYAETYAKENDIPFIIINKLVSDDNIIVTYPSDSSIAESTSLRTKLLSETDEEYKNINISDKIVDSSISADNVKLTAYDISLVDTDGNVVQPGDNVTVKVPCPTEYTGENCKVYRVNSDGSFTDMKAQYSAGYLVFETNHFSTYIITETELVTKPDVILGDANGDGKVDIKDSAIIRRHIAGWEVEIDLDAADMNGDGDVSIKDSALIKRQIAGWE